MAQFLKDSVRKFGSGRLGISPEDIGTHSICSGFAMALVWGGTPVFEVMIIGRWSSDAFVKYIRSQVIEFSKGISQKMISN